LRGPMRVLSVALCLVFLLVLGRFWNATPAYEAFAVVQIRPGGDSVPLIESRLFTRDMLEATAARHGIASAVALSQAIALQPLTSAAGTTLGYAVQNIGLLVIVRLPDPDQAVRTANDLALQIMDLADAGQIDAGAERLSLYRAEEDRLWQEIAALSSGQDLDAAGQRQLALMESQYAEVQKNLAQFEVRARIEGRLLDAPYAILARAHEAKATTPPFREALSALAAAALALALMSSLIGREINWPFPPGPFSDSGRNRSS
jgi:hypothetical protein